MRTFESVTIASGASLSSAVRIDTGSVLVALQTPASWTAADLTLQGSVDGVTYNNLYDSTGSEYSIAGAASRFIHVADPVLLMGLHYLKVRSGTSGTPVNQGADRIIKLALV